MKKPTLEQMKAWRDKATERLSVLARNNAIEEPIESGEECYQLGDDCCKPDGYGQFCWVTEDQFDSVLPPGIEHDRYVAMTNTFDFDGEAKEWADNWNDPEYWDDAADEALGTVRPTEPTGQHATRIRPTPTAPAPSPRRRSPSNWTATISSNARRRTSDYCMTSSTPSTTRIRKATSDTTAPGHP